MKTLPGKYIIGIENSFLLAFPFEGLVRTRIIQYFVKHRYELIEESTDRLVFLRVLQGTSLTLEPHPLNMRPNSVEIIRHEKVIKTVFKVNTIWLKPWERSFWENQAEHFKNYIASGEDSNADFKETLSGIFLEGLVDLVIVILCGLVGIVVWVIIAAQFESLFDMSKGSSLIGSLFIVIPLVVGLVLLITKLLKNHRLKQQGNRA